MMLLLRLVVNLVVCVSLVEDGDVRDCAIFERRKAMILCGREEGESERRYKLYLDFKGRGGNSKGVVVTWHVYYDAGVLGPATLRERGRCGGEGYHVGIGTYWIVFLGRHKRG